jgi:antitoxin MazE
MSGNAQVLLTGVPEHAMACPVVVPFDTVPVGHGFEVINAPVVWVLAHFGVGFYPPWSYFIWYRGWRQKQEEGGQVGRTRWPRCRLQRQRSFLSDGLLTDFSRVAIQCIYKIRKGVGMEVTVTKWGNSLGLRIPKSLAVEAGLAAGDVLEMASSPEGIVVKKARKHLHYDLDALLAGVTEENRHEAISLGEPRGRELL